MSTSRNTPISASSTRRRGGWKSRERRVSVQDLVFLSVMAGLDPAIHVAQFLHP
jgi:hypothetical protein